MLLGAHVSASGGVENAVTRGLDIGAECVQIFAASPRSWASKLIPQANVDKYHQLMDEHGLGPTLIHGKYLNALASPIPETVDKSVEALVTDLRVASQLNAIGVVFHPASHKGRGLEAVLEQFVSAVKRILDEAQSDAFLMLETSAGMGDHIGSKFSELGTIIKEVNDPRVAVCIDTQHVWASGYDISSKESLDQMFQEFDREIGLDRLKTIHANDSKKPLGSAVDRHENIGFGEIGEAGFLNFMSHPAVQDIPFYLEVPGMEKTGPDAPNIETLKRLRASIKSS